MTAITFGSMMGVSIQDRGSDVMEQTMLLN
jgi:hypothetical protein